MELNVEQYASIIGTTVPSDKDKIINALGDGGLLSRVLDGYEPRPAQIEMAVTVMNAIRTQGSAVIEAGTGVGKSFAYLLPVILSGKRAIVSTANIALQGQLRDKDLPFLQSLSGQEIASGVTFPHFEFAVAKGKVNFVCKRKVNYGQTLLIPVYDEKLAAWLEGTVTGDVEEMPVTLTPEQHNKMCVGDDCLKRHCEHFEGCFYQTAKARYQDVDVVVCNHSLLCINLKLAGYGESFALLPRADVLVVDEAHQLEKYAIGAYSVELTMAAVRAIVRDYGAHTGVPQGIPGDARARSERESLTIDEAIDRMFDRFEAFASSSDGQGRILKHGADVAVGRHVIFDASLADKLAVVANGVWSDENPPKNAKDQECANQAKQLRDLSGKVRDICGATQAGYVRHIERRESAKGYPYLVAANTRWDVSSFLSELTRRHNTVVYTSATLSVGRGGFKLFENRAGLTLEPPTGEMYICFECGKPSAVYLDECECGCNLFDLVGGNVQRVPPVELEVGSPFDYERNCLLYIPKTMPDTNSPDYLAACIDQCKRLVQASGGRAFVLCTSNYAMRQIGDALCSVMPNVRIQGDLPKPTLLAWFKSAPGAVLVATNSFWEGVDVKGNALSLVVIDKLPFTTPTDPVFKARCEDWDSRNPNRSSFMWIALPETIIRLKQGFGRLIRSADDRGVVAVLDARLMSKKYGPAVVAALPRAKVTHDAQDVAAFFGGGAR